VACSDTKGYVPEARLAELYRKATGLILPSHYEGFGLPIIEAMSQGCPVITRKHSSLTEVGGSAAIFCQDDPEEIALALETKPGYYSEVCANSLRHAAKFDCKSAAAKVLDLYQSLASLAPRSLVV
jgi:glycosyltransferase involved in cell wall biosynthesis